MNLNDFVKIAITAAVTAALTFNIQVSITNNNYNQLSNDVQDVKLKVDTVRNDTQILKENVTDSIIIQNKILKEVK
jgi:outer membrane murein-binding lipoprotein Lpp